MAMSEAKPFASLSSGLLARKGAAKPAMRPQGFGHLGTGIEDLGWNDMGGYAPQHAGLYPEEPGEHVPSSISALTPAPRSNDIGEKSILAQRPVADQQRVLEQSFAPEVSEEGEIEVAEAAPVIAIPVVPAPVVALPRRPRAAPGQKAKAAFTLRLDPDRHLKLRLACAVRHRSAQQIVTQALDEFLKSVPELESLAEQLPAKAAKRN
jgi:hypothetical protein